IATIALSFLISTLFDKAKLAAACAGIIYFLLYLPTIYFNVQQDEITYSEKMAGSLSSTTAFGLGCDYIASLERLGIGLQWDNIDKAVNSCDGFSVMHCLGMLWLDTIIYMLLTLYIENIRPGEYGL